MVIYKAKVVKVEPVYGEAGNPIEAWVTFGVNEFKIETFHVGSPIAPPIGKEYAVNFKLMTYDLYQINIEEKMLKQISTFPMDPIYIATGKVEEYDRENKKILFDCGILLECDTKGKALEFWAERIKVGDWIYVKGKMFGEIVKK